MKKISYKGYRFPPEIIQQSIWLYFRFILSFRGLCHAATSLLMLW
jgi:putative transposase